MPTPLSRISADFFAVPVVVRVVSVAISVAALARVLLGVFSGPGDLAARVIIAVFAVGLSPPTLLIIALFVLALRGFFRHVREYVPAHRATVTRAARWFALFLLVLALFVVAAVVWRGHGAGAVAWVVVRLLLAVGLGGGALLLALWPLRGGGRRSRHDRLVLAVVGAWPVGGVFLVAVGQAAIGGVLLGVFVLFLFGFVPRNVNDDYSTGAVALLYLLLFGLLWLRLAEHALSVGTLARWVGEAALVAALGTTTGLTIWRHSRGARTVLRHIGTAATVLVPAYLLFLLLDDQVFGGLLAVPMFPVLVWQAVRLWRWMGASRRIGIKAAADVVFALALGTTLLLVLIWLADLLAMSPAEVNAVKHVAATIHEVVDLPPWLWASVYAVLTAAFLLAALGSRRFQAVPRRLASARVVPAVKALRRTSTMTGIGLLVVALLGLAVPPTLGPVLARQIRVTYTVAAQQELAAEQASAVYRTITAQVALSPPQLTVLNDVLVDVHKVDPPDGRTGAASAAELDLAHRIGRLQGELLAGSTPAEAPVTPPDLDEPIHDTADLQARLGEQQDEQTVAKARQKQAETASELAATTVTSLLDLAGLGHAEALGIVREYLDGLAESRLGQMLLSWIRHALVKVAPAEPLFAELTLEPDAPLLATEAGHDLFTAEMAEGGIPSVPRIDSSGRSTEAAVRALVDTEKQTAQVRQQHICPNCLTPPEHDARIPEEEHGFGR